MNGGTDPRDTSDQLEVSSGHSSCVQGTNSLVLWLRVSATHRTNRNVCHTEPEVHRPRETRRGLPRERRSRVPGPRASSVTRLSESGSCPTTVCTLPCRGGGTADPYLRRFLGRDPTRDQSPGGLIQRHTGVCFER